MSEPGHTVVVAAYNAADTVGDAIGSVLAQTVSDLEIVVVDDGSSDATPEILSELAAGDERIRVVRQETAGASAARNAALERARGEYLTILDSDDLVMPRYLESMAGALEADPRAGLAYTRAWVLDETAEGRGRVRRETYPARWQVRHWGPPPSEPEDTVRALALENFVGAVQTVRRTAIERAGGYDEQLQRAMDYDLWLRIAIAGYRFVTTDEVLALARDRPTSLSKHTLEVNRAVRIVCERLIGDYDVSDAARDAARRQLQKRNHIINALTGADPLRATVMRLRRPLGRLRRRLVASRPWYREPPPEVVSAFPSLLRRVGQPRTRT